MLFARLRRSAHILWLTAVTLVPAASFATQPFRVLSPAGGTSNRAVLVVPGCCGFTARNGINHYGERARGRRTAGSQVLRRVRGLPGAAITLRTALTGRDISHADVAVDIAVQHYLADPRCGYVFSFGAVQAKPSSSVFASCRSGVSKPSVNQA